MRDARPGLEKRGIDVVGISPDLPDKQKKFQEKYALQFRLLSDADHSVAEKYGTWAEKKMYGKTFMGIVRSAFLIDASGRILCAWYKISPKNTVPELIKYLEEKTG